MPGRRVHLPQPIAQPDFGARLQQRVKAKLRASLSGGRIGQRIHIPVPHRLGQPGRYGGAQRRVMALQGSVAAAVVAVQMGVDQLVQRASTQGRFDQGHRLRRVAGVAAVNQGGVVLAQQQDVVRR